MEYRNGGVQKLTNMEAQRVINCMEDSLGRLALMAHVPVGNPDPEILSALGDNDLVDLQVN